MQSTKSNKNKSNKEQSESELKQLEVDEHKLTNKDIDENDEISVSDESTTDFDDVELLQKCNRVDLFMLIKEDPKYYIDLIKKNKLEHTLNILISRSNDGNGLNIKFKIYPEDRWIEVGYWGESTDQEVYNEFIDQIKIQLNKSRYGKKNQDQYAHLTSQLDNNNNILSPDYGKNDPTLKNIGQFQFKTQIEERLESMTKNKIDKLDDIDKLDKTSHKIDKTSQRINNSINKLSDVCKSGCNDKAVKRLTPTIHKSRLAPENLKECLEENIEEKPMEYLSNFVAQLLEKIIEEVPKIVIIEKNRNYAELLTILMDKHNVPDNYKTMHNKLINQIQGCEYIQRIHYLTDWSLYPELKDYLIDFHREAMQQNPTLYTKIKKDDLLKILDDDDKLIMDKYCLDIQEIWLDYLNHQD